MTELSAEGAVMGVDEPEVRTTAGVVRGAGEASGSAVFKGIPFAEPPVGALRFGAPRPVRSWDGVRKAVEYGTPPPQSAAFGMDALVSGDAVDEGDWLSLNVWTPDPAPGAGLPVIVWMHGGGYVIGMSGLPEYDGGRLAREGAVVVVTLNYRVGIEGFAHIEGAPANRGLLDQVAALEWVRDNIRAFGGDPDRVTIVGQSAGAGSVAALLAMERAAGLFGRAVAQSVPGVFFSPELAADIAREFAAELGVRPTVEGLGAVAPRRLPAVVDAVGARGGEFAERWGPAAHALIPVAPVVDGEVLPRAPWEALASGAGRDVELVVGHTRDEFRLMMMLRGLIGEVTEDQAEAALRTFGPGGSVGDSGGGSAAGSAAGSGGGSAGGSAGGDAYRAAFPAASAEELYELVQSDWVFRMPSLHLAEAQIAGGGRAHVYELVWEAPGMGGILGACHGLDVPLVFGNLGEGLPALLLGEEPPAAAEELSRLVRAAWTGFAAGEKPGWSPYDIERRSVRLFDAIPSEAAYPEEVSRGLWREHVFGALPLRG
ncbi:carboxylesterase/lipase family protein [Streptomyces sp. NBC_00878]|uniref:carboxylesterase/lipase family protein n=1 Tax=Streptomyces sp. NBC_00878 TaxID=2975854 RepID=UPI002253911E|nr:carboxylesterase family protein [Streptomyces sp. NBC_00878]MCX4907797.1 carboxylesterase family protein [Streptomyces sp. NBC_00878]